MTGHRRNDPTYAGMELSIRRALGDAAGDYNVRAIAETLHDDHGTWDLTRIPDPSFWAVADRYRRCEALPTRFRAVYGMSIGEAIRTRGMAAVRQDVAALIRAGPRAPDPL